MKTETFLIVSTVFFTIATIAGLILGAHYVNPPMNKKWVLLWRICWIFAGTLFFLTQMNGKAREYSLSSEQDIWTKYHIPQIDSTMVYYHATKHSVSYMSYSKDSIVHFSKCVTYDIFDIYSVTDLFHNSKERKSLFSTFIMPNILRDSSRVFKVENWDDPKHLYSKSLSKQDFDNIMIKWGLTDNLYKRFKVR